MRGKGTFKVQPRLRVEYTDDPKLLEELLKFILNTIKLADMSSEEAEKFQQREIDSI